MVKRDDLIYLSGYGVWLFLMQIMSTTYSELLFDTVEYYKIFTIFSFILLLFLSLFIYRLNEEYILKDLFILSIFLLVIFFSKTFGVLAIYALLFLLAKYIPFSKILKVYIFIFLTIILIVFLGFIFDFLPPVNLLNESFRDDGQYRYALGFTYTTFLPNYFFHVILAFIFLREKKLGNIEIFTIFIINFILYKYTDTKAVYYLINLIIIVLFFIKIFPVDFNNKSILSFLSRLIVKYSFLILCVLSIYLHCFYDHSIEWMNSLNEILADRLRLGHQGIEKYGVTLFGNDVEYVSFNQVTEFSPYFFLDSSYQRILINFGAVLVLLLVLGFTQLSKLIIFNNNIYYGISIVFLLGHSFTDPQLLDPIFNPFSLILAYIYSHIGRCNLFR